MAEDLLGAATTTWEMNAREDDAGTGGAAEAISVELNTPALSREQIQASLAINYQLVCSKVLSRDFVSWTCTAAAGHFCPYALTLVAPVLNPAGPGGALQ